MLFHQIKLGYPSVWVKTVDTLRSIEMITNYDSRTYFQIDPIKGFCQYKNGSWKQVLVDLPNPDSQNPADTIKSVVHDFSIALEYIEKTSFDKNPSFIFHLITEPDSFLMYNANRFASFNAQYREAFWNNDTKMMPLQAIIVSPFDCPEKYSHIFNCTEQDYPTKEELSMILSHMHVSSDGIIVNKNKSEDIIKASLGLSETDFINLALQSVLDCGEVSADYIYQQKMSSIKKNGILEIMKPKVTFDNIGGLDNIKDLITRNSYLWNNPAQAESYGISPIRRILMVGVPGTGKSAICEATASAMNLDLARTGVSQVMNSYIGQSEANMRAVFKQIHAMAPLCVWIDEFGRDLSGGQSSHVDGGTTDRVHGEFLTGLQELPQNVFLMCAANQIENLKPEMLRADRFDKIYFVGLPSFAERRDIFTIHLSKVPSSRVFDYDALAEATKYFTGAEIKSLVQEVKFYVSSSELRIIKTEDILSHIPKMRNILWNKSRTVIQDLYRTAIDQWDWASSAQYEDYNSILNPSLSSAKISVPKIPTTR